MHYNRRMEFADQGTEEIYDGLNSPKARKTLPLSLHQKARDKFALMDAAESIDDLRVPPSNHLEALRGDRQGQYSIRINGQYRICFMWTEDGPIGVEIVDYH